jgi:RsiW-degrading membrane proteinase PrsW (M82 family)
MTAAVRTLAGPRSVRNIVAWAGLAVSAVTLLAALPRLFAHGGGAGRVVGNTVAVAWTVLLIVFAIRHVRTLGPRALVGAWFSGFFGVLSLATLAGRPVVDHWGATSAFAVVFWVPLTEELLKLLPVALVLLLTRRQGGRFSAGDAVLFGAVVGGAFTVNENALYARPVGGLGAHVPVSLLIPSVPHTSGFALAGGHLVYTALAALGLAITVIYRRRVRWAVWAAPVALADVVLEHAAWNQNGLDAAGANRPLWLVFAHIVTLDGWLSSLLLIAGVAWVAVVERRLVAPVPRSTSEVRS